MASNFDNDERILGGGEPGGSFDWSGPHAAGNHAYRFQAVNDWPPTACGGGLFGENRYQFVWSCSHTVGLSFAPCPITLLGSGSPRETAVVLFESTGKGGQLSARK